MLRTRVIPALLLRHGSLVKTRRFQDFVYVGDPCNTVRIFNELEVDELFFLDITASREGAGPNMDLLSDIAQECFMPLGYGGGIATLADAKAVFDIGFEKVAVNSQAVARPGLVVEIAETYGGQAVVVSIDVKGSAPGEWSVYTHGGRKNSGLNPIAWAMEVERLGAGEILLTSIDREGTWSGFDLDLIRQVADAVSIPVVAQGGAGTVADVGAAVQRGHAAAVALGSMVVFQKQGMGVLVHFPEPADLAAVLA